MTFKKVVTGAAFGASLLAVSSVSASASPARTLPNTAASAAEHSGNIIAARRISDSVGGPPVITCEVALADPHYSHHAHAKNRNWVNVKGGVTCNWKVTSLDTGLWLSYGPLWESVSENWAKGKSKITDNTQADCKPGPWHGQMDVEIIFPLGYIPEFGHALDKSSADIKDCKPR